MIPLEDDFEDILAKAMRGLGIDAGELAFLSGLPLAKIVALRRGEPDEEALLALAPVLGLHGPRLVERARGTWRPAEVSVEGLRQFTTRFGDMLVNAYLLWDPATREAAFFDTGADARGCLVAVEELGLSPVELFLTHTHPDHVRDRRRIEKHYPRIVSRVNALEPVEGARQFLAGECFPVGGLEVATRLTRGHSQAGTTYVVGGLQRPVAIVGDALFAQSMGGGAVSYRQALETNRREILSLPDRTVLCPGHGPMTTVGEEKAHNPFFPECK